MSVKPEPPAVGQFATWLADSPLFPSLIEIASHLEDTRVLTVGGAVRDFLWSRSVDELRDIDIMVDAPPEVTFATLDSLFPFERTWFGNRSYLVRDLGHIDVFPPATPRLQPCSVEHALECADLSVNALAVDLRSHAFLDPTGGLRDLEVRHCRPLADGWDVPPDGLAFLLGRLCDSLLRHSFESVDWEIPDEAARVVASAFPEIALRYREARGSFDD